ncbi:MAG: hypothetical protein M0R40_08765 [Firmicutes bacterium]|nr:hypothetical protein [Bacillota bacterium]
MHKKYTDLNELIQYNFEASQYFSGLPQYVKEQIEKRQESVNSLASLQDYAENLLRGDI